MSNEFPLLYIRASQGNEAFHVCEISNGRELQAKKNLPHKNLIVFIGRVAAPNRLLWRSHLFRDVEIDMSRESVPLSLTCDRFGTSPIFYRQENGVIEISSKLQELTRLSTDRELLEKARTELTEKNYLSSGKTIFSGVKKLLPSERLFIDSKFQLTTELTDSKTQHFGHDAPTREWCDELLRLLKNAIVRGIESGITHAALSGGADSRLILGLTPPELRAALTYYTKLNPLIDVEADRDLRAARLLAKECKLKHVVVEKPEMYWAFLQPEFVETKVLSGLYGGEFLGGALLNMLPEENTLKHQAPSSEQHFTEAVFEVAQASMNSSLTLFYGAQVVGWATPYAQLNGTYTPFLDESVIEHLLKIDPKNYCRYSAYSQIWQTPSLASLARIPFLSDLARFQGFPADTAGVDPKTTDMRAQAKQTLAEKVETLLNEMQRALQGRFPL